jgi:hypothetical protein
VIVTRLPRPAPLFVSRRSGVIVLEQEREPTGVVVDARYRLSAYATLRVAIRRGHEEALMTVPNEYRQPNKRPPGARPVRSPN